MAAFGTAHFTRERRWSDHEDASATVASLAESLGFAAIEVGKIAEGGRLIQARAPWYFRT